MDDLALDIGGTTTSAGALGKAASTFLTASASAIGVVIQTVAKVLSGSAPHQDRCSVSAVLLGEIDPDLGAVLASRRDVAA